LYHNGGATITLGGIRLGRLAISSGIRQGRPASGTFSALAIDPCIRFLEKRIGVDKGLVTAYAADIAAVLRDLYESIVTIVRAFDRIQQCTTLELHPGKVIIIPLWKFKEEQIRKKLHAIAPATAKAIIKNCG
jgi:hypothetical protein